MIFTGYLLHIGERTTNFNILDYPDDTTLSLRVRSAVLSVITIRDNFAAVSGLMTNRAKSMTIELALSDHPCLWTHVASMYSVQPNLAGILMYLWSKGCDNCQLIQMHTISIEWTCIRPSEGSHGRTMSSAR